MKNILVVDDNQDMRFMLTSILRDEGFKVTEMETAEAMLKKIKSGDDVDLVLLDNQLPGINGMEALKKVKEINEDVIVIMLTAFGKVDGAVEAMKEGAYDYITKPFENKELLLIINRAMERSELGTEIKTLKRKLNDSTLTEDMLGKSSQVKDIIKQIGISPGYETDFGQFIEWENLTQAQFDTLARVWKSSGNADTISAFDFVNNTTRYPGSEFFGLPLSNHRVFAFYLKGKYTAGITSNPVFGMIYLDSAWDNGGLFPYRLQVDVKINTAGRNQFLQEVPIQ